MGEFLHELSAEAGALTALEAVAFVLGVAYLLLVIRESVWCWPSAFISSSLFAGLFAVSRIYMDAGLQAFYAGMAVYGWWVWRSPGPSRAELRVHRWSLQRHAAASAVIGLVSAVSGWLLATYTDAAYPYVDSLTTFASFWATFLVARKVMENWYYWLVIDGVSIAIYLERGLKFAALLFAVYLVLIPFGIVAWSRSMTEGSTSGVPA
ncbi:MAG: nicotinamide riboside transporter PnuC [Pseudomonadota bacterium]